MRIQSVVIDNKGIFVNGMVVGQKGGLKTQTVEKKKIITDETIQKIAIESSCLGVTLGRSETGHIEVCIYGEMGGTEKEKAKVQISTSVADHRLKIGYDLPPIMQNLRLNFEVLLPEREFQELSIDSKNGDIFIKEINVLETVIKSLSGDIHCDIISQKLSIKNQNGDIHCNTSSPKINLETLAGDIKIEIDAKSNTELKGNGVSGNIKCRLNNICYVNFSANTVLGSVKNKYRECEEGGYRANIKLNTVSGNIVVK